MTLQQRIKKIFSKNNINHQWDCNENKQQVYVSIFDGDWKHDHLFLKRLMGQKGFDCVDEYITSTDSDCYDCEYTFQLN